jgi:hypothetical protein
VLVHLPVDATISISKLQAVKMRTL